MWELLIVLGAGILAWAIAGLLPGVHVNLVCTLLLAAAPALLKVFSGLELAIFIIAMSVAQSFLDPLPAIFLGAPEADTGLGVLPGHRYLLRGFGLMAVKLTVLGSLGGLVLSLLLFPVFSMVVRYGYPLLEAIMGYALAAIALFMILRDRRRGWAALVFGLSGLLGLLTFRLWKLENPMFPLLSGLFGISTLLYSINTKARIPPQQVRSDILFDKKRTAAALASGLGSGFLTAVLPGVGAGLAAIISIQIARDLRDHGFMILMGVINTANFVLSLVALEVLGKGRNGAVLAIQGLLGAVEAPHVLLFMAAALAAGGAAAVISLKIGVVFSAYISRAPYGALALGVIAFIVLLCGLLTGWLGLLVLATSTAIGLVPAAVKTGRVQAMGVILLPVITYFLG